MGYKNDQFFNSYEGSYAERVAQPALNPNFDFDEGGGAASRVRYIEKDGNGWGPQSVNLQRGYIRSLLSTAPSSSGSPESLGIVKCNFQFNPQYINHRVPMRTGLTNLFLQDPAQFSQPIAGDVTFSFELVFDRSYRINNTSDQYNGKQGSPGESNIGVLADLRALYEVIGQGVSQQLVDFQKKRALEQVQVEYNQYREAATTTTTDDNGVKKTTFEGKELNTDRLEKGLENVFDVQSNYGNSAFLIPMPVRVVFSSLFMVDGYVTETDVTYTKFTSSLVPIQCTVSLSMQAMYVGFAKKTTFLTANLDNAAAEIAQQTQQLAETARSVNNTVEASIKKFNLKPETKYTWTENVSGIGKVTRSETISDLSQLLRSEKSLKEGGQASITNYQPLLRLDFQKDEGEIVMNLFKEAVTPSIKVDTKIYTYGATSNTGFSTKGAAETARDQIINSLQGRIAGVPIGEVPSAVLLSEVYLANDTITDGASWDAARKGTPVKATVNHIHDFDSDAFTNNLGKYFVVVCFASVAISSGSTRGPIVWFSPESKILKLQTGNEDPPKISFGMNKA